MPKPGKLLVISLALLGAMLMVSFHVQAAFNQGRQREGTVLLARTPPPTSPGGATPTSTPRGNPTATATSGAGLTPTTTSTSRGNPTATPTSGAPTSTPTSGPSLTPTQTATSRGDPMATATSAAPTSTPTSGPSPMATQTPSGAPCPPATYTDIGAVQGTGAASPVVGQTVTIFGRVIGDFQDGDGLDGFFVQDDGDGNPNTSDGIFIASNSPVNAGDPVQVQGKVSEYFGRTQLVQSRSLYVCGTAPNIIPVSLSLPVPSSDALEKYEGMLVTFPQSLYVTENYDLGRYGELSLASERLWQPTNVTAPGPAALAWQAANDLKRIVLDDGSNVEDPDPIDYPAPGLTAGNTLRSGDTVTGLTGVLDYASSDYRIQPTTLLNWAHVNPRPSNPAVGGTLRVASFNVLNYFNGPAFPTSRGADTPGELARQEDKLVSAILGLDADIIGLVELENDGFGANSAIQQLVNSLNASAPSGTTYDLIDGGVPQVGWDEITVGLIYRLETVQPVGPAAIKTDGAFASLNRAPLAQTFVQLSTGSQLTVAVNHFKSKGSSCPGDPDTGDGQGNCNQTRVAAANDLTTWLAADPTGSDDPDFLITGDLNAYAQEDPIEAIKSAGYTSLLESNLGLFAYSYVYFGQAGYLDQALASSSLVPQVAGATLWHINADEPVVLDYNTEYKSPGQLNSLYSPDAYRSSDHDPVVVGLNLAP